MDQGIVDLRAESKPDVLRRLDVPITGMSCAACVARVERVAGKVPGVETAAVNLASERASLRTGPAFRLSESLL